MTGPRRGRGRQDNGLDAVLWSPLRDVDPRVGEHLLDVLREAGIAAYLEPSADVGPYTRTVFLPSPPSDRLFVDRTRRAEARTLVDQHGDDHPAARPAAPRPLRADLDEAAEWARIVAAFEAENGPLTLDAEPLPQPAQQAPAPAVQQPAPGPPEPEPEEHFEPPPPPPLPVPSPASLYSVLMVVLGAVLVWAPGLLGLSADVGLVLGCAAVAGGVGVLVARMRERSARADGDDGAVV